MSPVASGGRYISICERMRLSEDMAIGFIIECMLKKKKLTIVPEFHSHMEKMKLLSSNTFRYQTSFSYSKKGKESNVLNVAGFNATYDPTRFLSLHYFLFPDFKYRNRNDFMQESQCFDFS